MYYKDSINVKVWLFPLCNTVVIEAYDCYSSTPLTLF